jgi:hypothetical protein
MNCKTLKIGIDGNIEKKVNNWFLHNSDINIKFFDVSFIPPKIIYVHEGSKIKEDYPEASHTERKGFFVITIIYE